MWHRPSLLLLPAAAPLPSPHSLTVTPLVLPEQNRESTADLARHKQARHLEGLEEKLGSKLLAVVSSIQEGSVISTVVNQ